MNNSILLQIITLFCLVLTLNYYYKAIDKNLAEVGHKWLRSSVFFNYLFFVGTMIHELSHAITATLLGVRIYKISLFWPQRDESGNYRLGYVEHKKVDPIRTTLIGIAPIFGCALTTYLMFLWISPGLSIDSQINLSSIIEALKFLVTTPDRWQNYLFIYFAIACSLAGDPSDADKKSLPWLLLILVSLIGIFYLTKELSLWGFAAQGSKYILNNLEPYIFGVNVVLLFELSILTIIFGLTKLLNFRR